MTDAGEVISLKLVLGRWIDAPDGKGVYIAKAQAAQAFYWL